MSRPVAGVPSFHECRVERAHRLFGEHAKPIEANCLGGGSCGAKPGWPCKVSRPETPLDLAAIRARCDSALRFTARIHELLESARDVPILLAEIARLQQALDAAARGDAPLPTAKLLLEAARYIEGKAAPAASPIAAELRKAAARGGR